MRLALALVLMSACASAHHPQLMPSSAPAYVALGAGEVAPADGFFLSLPGARAKLLDDRLHDLQLAEQLAELASDRDAAEKRADRSAFCATYCLEIGAGGVIVVELIAVGFYAALHR